MSRWSLGNVVKVGAVVVFLPLLAYLVLVIGAVRKNLRVGLEGLLYAAGFSVGIVVFDVIGLGGLLALASMGASGVRAWHLRDHWLPARRRWWHRFVPAQPSAVVPVSSSPPPEAALGGADGRAAALQWVEATARQHQHRLPPGPRASFLGTCEVLRDVVEAERRAPSMDAGVEYELDAMVRQYLPAVLRGYLAVPASLVDSRQPNGLTPNDELTEQVTLLATQARTLQEHLHSRMPAQLTTTGNFLRDKFGHRSGEFDVGVTPQRKGSSTVTPS